MIEVEVIELNFYMEIWVKKKFVVILIGWLFNFFKGINIILNESVYIFII